MYSTVIIDTNCLAHICWRKWYGESAHMQAFIEDTIHTYSYLPFMPEPADHILWVGDSKPYFRTKMMMSESMGVYKGTRSDRSSEQQDFLSIFNKVANPVLFPHYEADDLIAGYIRERRDVEKIRICTVDSDLMQLIHANVDWFCIYGFPPQLRSLTGGMDTWLTKKFSKLSNKRIGHLDVNNPQSIIDWKVEYGDIADNIPAGEQSRSLIDLFNPPAEYLLSNVHPNFIEIMDDRKVKVRKDRPKWVVRKEYEDRNYMYFPTKVYEES